MQLYCPPFVFSQLSPLILPLLYSFPPSGFSRSNWSLESRVLGSSISVALARSLKLSMLRFLFHQIGIYYLSGWLGKPLKGPTLAQDPFPHCPSPGVSVGAG